MPQIFHRGLNSLAKVILVGAPLMLGGTALGLAAFYRSGYATGMNEVIEQPVPFSHKHHVGELGIDCRYCHNTVETSAYAGIPPTKVCMNCHQQIWTGAELLQPVRESYRLNEPIVWTRVHNTPHYVYFNHSIHISKGVGCFECHGRIDEMALTFQSKTLLMEWCVKCHREPETHLRPREEVFNMTWKPGENAAELAKTLKENHGVRDATTLTSCSMCHR
jgi:hypothetical protein